nr:MAG TPA: Dynactin p62 family [Caudoviricetes sp.]
MKKMYCKTCLSYYPDEDKPGYGVCKLSECEVCEQCPGCIDWRYFKIWYL